MEMRNLTPEENKELRNVIKNYSDVIRKQSGEPYNIFDLLTGKDKKEANDVIYREDAIEALRAERKDTAEEGFGIEEEEYFTGYDDGLRMAEQIISELLSAYPKTEKLLVVCEYCGHVTEVNQGEK